jgi:hypothetical protein
MRKGWNGAENLHEVGAKVLLHRSRILIKEKRDA